MVRDPPFFASLFEVDDADADADFDRRMMCDGGTGSSERAWTTDEGDTRRVFWLAGGATSSAPGPWAKRRFGDDAVAGEGQ